jgi:hypothetical protein
MNLCPVRIHFLAAGLALLVAACGPGPSAPGVAAVARVFLSAITEFGSATLPLKKFGRAAASISVSSGRVLIKVETEIGKNGVKIGGQLPLSDFRSIANSAFWAQNGRAPNGDFDANSSENASVAFLIVTYGNETEVFVVDSAFLCVGSIESDGLFEMSFSERYLKLRLTSALSDVVFGTDASTCTAIRNDLAVKRDIKAAADRESNLRHTYELLGIAASVVRTDSSTGEVVLRVERGSGSEEIVFNASQFQSKNGIRDFSALMRYVKQSEPSIDRCTLLAIENAANHVARLEYRAACLTNEGINSNDQKYFEARGTLRT